METTIVSEKINELGRVAFAAGRKYQQLQTLKQVSTLADKFGFTVEQQAIIARGLGLLEEIDTDADVPDVF